MFDTTEYRRDLSVFVNVVSTENLDFSTQLEDTAMGPAHQLQFPTVFQPNSINLGRAVSAMQLLEPSLPQTQGFQLSTPLFTPFFYQKDSTRYYDSKTPRTRLKFAQGTGNMLFLNAAHSQQIASNWSFGIDYTRTKAHNLYFNNLTQFDQERMTNLFTTNAYSHFYTPNRKYEVFANVINSKNTLKETFGISNSTAFDSLSGRAKTYSGSAILPDAENMFITRTFSIHQFFRDGDRTIQVNDTTSVNDTLTSSIGGQWFHSLTYNRHINRFLDNSYNEEVFPKRLLTLTTADSIFHSVLQNRIGRIEKGKAGSLKYWLLHEAIGVKQLQGHTSKLQHVQLGGASTLYIGSKASQLDIEAKYAPIGYYSGDYALNAALRQELPKLSWAVKADIIKHRPDYNDQFFGSNYYYWNQRLEKTDIVSVEPSIEFLKGTTKLNGTFRQTNNFVYYDTLGTPQQMNTGLTYLSASLSNHFKIGRSFHFKHRLVAQSASSANLPLPALSYKASIYKEGFLFKRNMWTRVGFDLNYFSEFDGYGYNPVVRQFTLSNTKIGGYPLVDFFINAKVRSMILFVSVNHFTQGFFINDSFSAENSPIIGRAFRFGVDWRLFE